MKTEVIQLYEENKQVTLTTYLLDNAQGILGGERPAVLICPGGAYLNCSDREGEPVAIAFAAMGYHAFVLRYSVYGLHGFSKNLANLEAKEESQYPQPMLDIAQAMVMIKERAQEWGVDEKRIVICGFSAGAHNCGMYATNWNNSIMTEHFDKDVQIFKPAACVLGYSLTDFLLLKEDSSVNPMSRELFKGMSIAFLGTSDAPNDKLEEVSPARNITQETPPMFLWATAKDDLVPVQHTLRMAHALADKKIPFEMHIFEEGAHGLSVATQASAESLSQINVDVSKWVGLADAWLQKRFAIELPELSIFEQIMH